MGIILTVAFLDGGALSQAASDCVVRLFPQVETQLIVERDADLTFYLMSG